MSTADSGDVTEEPYEFWDPHFHIWDATAAAPFTGGGDPAILASFTPGDDKLFTFKRIQEELSILDGVQLPIRYVGGCFIEAMTVCHPDIPADSLNPRCVQEGHWVRRNIPKNYYMCPAIQLDGANAEAALKELVRIPRVRGVRQILSHRPAPAEGSMPRNVSFDLLDNEAFLGNFGLLEKYNLHFEAHLESNQFAKAVALFSKHPNISIVVNHLGSANMQDLEGADTDAYWSGMAQLAALPQVSMKLSMLGRVNSDWNDSETVIASVHRIVKLFGVERCYFASNFPVDVAIGWPARRLFPAFLAISKAYTSAEVRRLFSTNARVAYRALRFASAEDAEALLVQSLATRDINSAVACYSRNAEVAIIKKDKIEQHIKGHCAIRSFYRSMIVGSIEVEVQIKLAQQSVLSVHNGIDHYSCICTFDEEHHVSSQVWVVDRG